MKVLQNLIDAKNTKCLDLSCDQAVLNKVVYGDIDKWKPYTAGDLHPPYAQTMCSQDVHDRFYVIHKNTLLDSDDDAHCKELAAKAEAMVGNDRSGRLAS